MWARAREPRTLIDLHGLIVQSARGALVANPAVQNATRGGCFSDWLPTWD